jgi:hypothetical protein
MPYTNFNLPQFSDGSPVNRADLRKLVLAIMRTGGDLSNKYFASGTEPATDTFAIAIFPATIKSTYQLPYIGGGSPPGGPSAQYNMVRAITKEGQDPNKLWTTRTEDTPGIADTFVATNIAELDKNGAPISNLLTASQQVIVYAIWNRSDVNPGPYLSVNSTDTKFYVFNFSPPIVFTIQIVGVWPDPPGAIPGAGGRYSCVVYTGAVSGQNASTDLDLPDSGESITITEAIFENTCESSYPHSHALYPDLTSPPPPLPFYEARFAGYDNSNPPVPIFRGTVPLPFVPFQIVYYHNDGTYDAIILGGPSTVNGAFTAPGGMTPAGSINAIACNLDESGLTGNRVKVPSYAEGQIVGAQASGILIIYFHGGVGTIDGNAGNSPVDLPVGPYGLPDQTTWNRDDNAAPVLVNFMTGWGVALDEDDNVVIWYNSRQAKYDARGILYSVTQETQVSGNVTLCSEES